MPKSKYFFCLLIVLLYFCEYIPPGTYVVPAKSSGSLCNDMVLNRGDTVVFHSSGIWDMGLGSVGPEGEEKLCECQVKEDAGGGHFKGRVGAVIGKIGEGEFFYIGRDAEVVAQDSGNLYLGANDNMGAPLYGIRGACYDDNRGFMEVGVKVKRFVKG